MSANDVIWTGRPSPALRGLVHDWLLEHSDGAGRAVMLAPTYAIVACKIDGVTSHVMAVTPHNRPPGYIINDTAMMTPLQKKRFRRAAAILCKY